MPRAGSPQLPPGGAVPPAPMNIGEAADPPFAVLPDPASLFGRRAARFAELAPEHPLEAYLRFLASVAGAQRDCLDGLPEPVLPPPVELEQAYTHSMPPVPFGRFEADAVFDATLAAFLDRLAVADGLPQASRDAIEGLRAADADARRAMADAVLVGSIPEDGVAPHVLMAAALQVHFARAAARLDASRLTPVADAACPSCGSGPVASMIVGWPGAHGTRFCACSMCGTLWNVVRIKCLLCGGVDGIAYHTIEGAPDVVKAETCERCHGYVKILHQHKDTRLEPVADDVGSLGLDLLLGEEDWVRGGANPFLTGY